MVKPEADSLYQLVKSLSKAEKRYFRVFTGKNDESSKGYLVLFDILSGTRRYDKEELMKKIREKNLSTDLPKTRQYLFDAIIKSLIFYYSENDPEFKMRLQLFQLLVLNKKELFRLAQKKLKIFERNCRKQNRTFLLAETYALMKTNAFNLYLNNYDTRSLSEMIQKEEANLHLLMNESRYRSLLIEMLTILKNESMESPQASEKKFRNLAMHPLLTDANKARTLRSSLIYFSIISIIQFKLRKNEDALKNASAYLNLIEKNHHLLRRNTFYYIVGLRNKILVLRQLGRHKELQAVLTKLRDVRCHNVNQKVIKFTTYYTFSLLSLLDSGDFEQAAKLVPEIEPELDNFGDLVEKASVLQLRMLIAKVHFGKKDYDAAITVLNRILGEKQIKGYLNICLSAKILLMLSHYELGNVSLMPSLARSIMRQMKLEGLENSPEYLFVKAFREKNLSPGLLRNLFSEMEVFITCKKLQPVLDFISLRDYMRSKVEINEAAVLKAPVS